MGETNFRFLLFVLLTISKTPQGEVRGSMIVGRGLIEIKLDLGLFPRNTGTALSSVLGGENMPQVFRGLRLSPAGGTLRTRVLAASVREVPPRPYS